MSKLIIIPLVFILISSIAFGFQYYNSTGGENSYFQTGTSLFNTGMTGEIYYTKTLTDAFNAPLVADLDLDGTNEIIVMDDDTLRLFNNKELDILDSYTFADGVTGISNMLAYNIDGDDYVEVILVLESSRRLQIMEWNGTAFFNQTSYQFDNAHGSSDFLIKCGGVDSCLAVYNDQGSFVTMDTLYATKFNSTGNGSTLLIDVAAGADTYCFSQVKDMTYANYDYHTDGVSEYIFTVVQYGNDNSWGIMYIDATTDPPTLELEVDVARGVPAGTGRSSCQDYSNEGDMAAISPPLVANLDGAASNGMETVIAVQRDTDEFIMYAYDSTGSQDERFPAIADADGLLVSNVILADVFTNSDEVDFCALGFDTNDGFLDLLCASYQGSHYLGLYDNVQFFYTPVNYYNISTLDNNVHDMMIHKHESSSNSHDELITTYGIFDIDFDSCNALADCELDLLWDNPKTNVALISVDAENFGAEDLIALQENNLWYIDDARSNEPAEIDEITFNPCPTDTVWKVNTTVLMTVTVDDQNPSIIGDDNVYSNVTVYYQDDNEFELESGEVVSGSSVQYSFTANQTITIGTIYVEGWDIENPDQIDTESITFSVANNGAEFGDSTCTLNIITSSETEAETQNQTSFSTGTTFESDNSVIRAMGEVSNLTQLGYDILWYIVMFIVAMTCIVYMPNNKGIALAIVILFLLLIIGTMLNFVPFGITLSILLVTLTVAGLFLRKMVIGTTS